MDVSSFTVLLKVTIILVFIERIYYIHGYYGREFFFVNLDSNLDISYRPVRTSSRRGGVNGRESATSSTLLVYMIIWCKIQVLINPLFM